jgi:hypothetical protein
MVVQVALEMTSTTQAAMAHVEALEHKQVNQTPAVVEVAVVQPH